VDGFTSTSSTTNQSHGLKKYATDARQKAQQRRRIPQARASQATEHVVWTQAATVTPSPNGLVARHLENSPHHNVKKEYLVSSEVSRDTSKDTEI
jgi:hypothetical protein